MISAARTPLTLHINFAVQLANSHRKVGNGKIAEIAEQDLSTLLLVASSITPKSVQCRFASFLINCAETREGRSKTKSDENTHILRASTKLHNQRTVQE
jgi:hypothetical protein